MIDHTGVIVSDLAKSKAFYSAALGAMGISLLKDCPRRSLAVRTLSAMERKKPPHRA
jgi:catechol 2,3-dioxygenase-like lactoylglutathione lyase family enzyme